MVKRIFRWTSLVLAVVCCFLIWHFSLADSTESATTSGGVMEQLNRLLQRLGLDALTHQTVRKIAHFTEFFALGFLLSMALYGCNFHHFFVFAVLLSLPVACIDELLQRLSPGRTPAFADVLLDSAGALCGALAFLLLFFLISAILKRKKEKSEKS